MSNSRYITEEQIQKFSISLIESERASATVKKYERAARELMAYAEGKDITKALLIAYREHLRKTLRAKTVNGRISAVNAFISFAGRPELRLKLLRIQQSSFLDEGKELTAQEYKRLLAAARDTGKDRLFFVMLTLCGTGIRISELKYITL